MYYVYSLSCRDGYYIGCTSDLKSRINKHREGLIVATKKRLPIKLEFYIAMHDRYKAFKLERYLKSSSGRAFTKKHLIFVVG